MSAPKTPVHPKVAAGTVAGAVVAGVVAILTAFGIDIPQGVSDSVVVIVSFIAGYFKS